MIILRVARMSRVPEHVGVARYENYVASWIEVQRVASLRRHLTEESRRLQPVDDFRPLLAMLAIGVVYFAVAQGRFRRVIFGG